MIRKYLFNFRRESFIDVCELMTMEFKLKKRGKIDGFGRNFMTPDHVGTFSIPDAFAAIEISCGEDFLGKPVYGVTAFHIERKVEHSILKGVGKLLHEDEDFDEKVREIIAAATALHPRVKVTV